MSAKPTDNLDEHSKKILAVRAIMKERELVREAGNFIKSDQLRDALKKSYGVHIVDQKNGPSGWKFLDGSSNKLTAGANIPLTAEQQQALSEKNRGDRKRKHDEKDAKREQEVRKLNDAERKSKVADLLKKDQLAAKAKEKAEVQLSTKVAAAAAAAAAAGPSIKVLEGVTIETVKTSTSPIIATRGKSVRMHYVGKLKSNGKVFDSSSSPFSFRLGAGEVIRGWDIGVAGMRVGEKRILTIPPEKGYGRAGAPPKIPPNATLVFDVTCIDVGY